MATLDTKLTVVEAYQSARKAEPDADFQRLRKLAEWIGNKFGVRWQDVTRWSVEFDNDTLEGDAEKPVDEVHPALTDEVRREAAERYSKLLQDEPAAPSRELAAIVANPLGVAPDAVQEWARKYGTFRRPVSGVDCKNADVLPVKSAEIAVDSAGRSTMMASAMYSESTNLASEARSRALDGQPPDSRGVPRGPNRFSETDSRLSGGLSAKEAHHESTHEDDETPTQSEEDELAAADAVIDAEFGDDGIDADDDEDGEGEVVAGAAAPHRRSDSGRGTGSRRSRRTKRSRRPAPVQSRGSHHRPHGVAANDRRDGSRPERSEAVREGGCVTMQAKANRKPISAPRLAPESRMMTMQEFASVMQFGRVVVDNFSSDVPTFDAGMLGVFIMNNGDEIDQAEALLAIVPIARRVVDRFESVKGGAS